MEEIINYIRESAEAQGACELIRRATDMRSLVEVFFSARGLEFCEAHSFPSLNAFRLLSWHGVSHYGVQVDAGYIETKAEPYMAFVGDTTADVHCQGVEHPYHIIVAHGARVSVHASDYAVVQCHVIGDAHYDINTTNHAIAL